MPQKPKIIVADDDLSIRTILLKALNRAGYDVLLADSYFAAKAMISSTIPKLLITDILFPDGNGLELAKTIISSPNPIPVIVMSAQNSFATALQASQNGAVEFLAKPFDLEVLITKVKTSLKEKNQDQKHEATFEASELPIIGGSESMQKVSRKVAKLIHNDLPILIEGATGTGKALVARSLHDYGNRKIGPFVRVSLASVPSDQIESEIFGSERTTLNGEIARKVGKIEQARGGTLVLDEICDLPPNAQARLLSFFESDNHQKSGSAKPTLSTTRIISTTSQSLISKVRAGEFREDLYFRLSVVPLELPELRYRQEDIKRLCLHFIETSRKLKLGVCTFTDGALAVIENYSWPGNVQELQNFVRRIVVLYPGEEVGKKIIESELDVDQSKYEHEYKSIEHIEEKIEGLVNSYIEDRMDAAEEGVYKDFLNVLEKPLLRRLLVINNNNQIKTAELLGMNRNTLRKKLLHLGLLAPERLNDDQAVYNSKFDK